MTTPTPVQPYLAFPFDVAPDGSIATAGDDDHVRDLILQVLLTQPGERVNQPEFGCGVAQLVFAGATDVLMTTAQFIVTQALERWLGDRLTVEAVQVTSPPTDDDTLSIEISYAVIATQQRGRTTVFV